MKTRPAWLLVVGLCLALFAVVPADAYAARCFQNYYIQMDACSELEGFWFRVACALDAELELAGCVRRTVLGL